MARVMLMSRYAEDNMRHVWYMVVEGGDNASVRLAVGRHCGGPWLL